MSKYIVHLIIWNILLLLSTTACSKEDIDVYELTKEQHDIIKNIPQPAIIAHRGTCYWAPESTEAAMRWARNAGTTYLEGDLQETKDGYLVIIHDNTLYRTSNVSQKFPLRQKVSIAEFTLEELWNLDVGSWFNNIFPQNARKTFCTLDILTLEDMIRIAEGFRIQRDSTNKRIYQKINERIQTLYEPDPADNGNRPGIYIETKDPEMYPGIELKLKKELETLGWYAKNSSNLKKIITLPKHVKTGNSVSRVILQTFSQASLKKLQKTFHSIPICFLIYISKDENIDINKYTEWVNFAIAHGAVIIGPCIPNDKNSFGDLLKPWMYDLIKEKGLLIHAYTFNNINQVSTYINRADGLFTDKVDMIGPYMPEFKLTGADTNFPSLSATQILDQLGY